MKRTEGFVTTKHGKVWYEIVGEENDTLLVLIHGGPGYPHDYLEPLEDLAEDRSVIFYDQLGCGNSDITTDPTQWTLEYFVSELQTLINSLKLEKYHILGQSWGSAVAVAFALTKPNGLVSVILSDPYISTSHWVKDAERLLEELPSNMQDALKKSDKASEEYKAASKEYYFRFVNRFSSKPEAVIRADKKMNKEIYRYMWGFEEFSPSGTLITLDLTPQLSEIQVPVLLLCGRYDEATPETASEFQSLLPNAQLVVFEESL
jgi:proline iminopeptidase